MTRGRIRGAGPARNRPYFTDNQFERITSAALEAAGLLPAEPSPIRVERFIERHFGITPVYEALPDGVLGYTEFGPDGPNAIYVSRRLTDEGSVVAERRVSSTLAHEAGHGLLHSPLFAHGPDPLPLFEQDASVTSSRILCRDEGARAARPGYDGRWWEYQANRAMACLLLPAGLVAKSIAPLTKPIGFLELPTLPEEKRSEAVQLIAGTFDVNPVVARLRLDALLPVPGQRSL